MPDETWIVYILECADKTLYTGVTNDLAKRLEKHESGKGAKYARGRAPYKIVFSEPHASKSAAMKREAAIKKLRKEEKLKLLG